MDDTKKQNYYTTKRAKFLIRLHIVLAVKYRKRILCNNIKNDMQQIIFDICSKEKWKIIAMESDIDHLHLLVDIQPKYSVSFVIHRIKQLSTYRIYNLHKQKLKDYFWKENTFWSDGYFVCSVGNAASETIEKYIETQG